MKKSIKTWGVVFAVTLLLQFGGFYALNRYLEPNEDGSILTVASANAAETNKKTPEPPLDARVYDLDPRREKIVFYDGHDQIVVRDKNQRSLGVVRLRGVDFLKWLDNGSTVFYARQNYSRYEIGVYRFKEDQVVPMYDVPGYRIQVQDVYKAAYAEMVYLVYRQNGALQLGAYQATTGWQSMPFPGRELKENWYDPKAEALFLKDGQGKVWKFVHGKLTLDEKQENKNPGLRSHEQSGDIRM
jgi:hypothetical protein